MAAARLQLPVLTSIMFVASIADSQPKISQEDAIKTAEEQLEGTYNGHPITLEYLVKDDGSVALTHVIQTRNKEVGTWYEGFIDAHSGELLGVVNFRSDAAVSVLFFSGQLQRSHFMAVPRPSYSAPVSRSRRV